ncbi:MAG: hypothetical protein AVDCRST_MAG85-530 [uncultured Solirubrobacteraceae bacterium]|uniref:Carboxypeptidase regulatory-like domain-containing protein n=1 Tax=uncultured Solirubrobacteraceae bacterium TaxID=1162706 RepID=A0A6J4RR07_9ACTN|nr:MAG: hypothetical protein AVDCRST_MAG85-530 [uncultured Solirubrobacteraceae bacterium]
MSVRRALFLVAVCAVAAPAPARADEAVAEVLRETPLAGYGGWSAWSRAEGDRFRLVLRTPQGDEFLPNLASSSRPFDVSLGPDVDSNVNAVYQRCTARGCDIRRYNTASGIDRPVAEVSSPGFREATPALWRSTIAFTRRVRGCDVPYVRNVFSSAPSRRLLRSKCLITPAGHLAIRGSRILVSSLDLSEADQNGAGRKTSEVRRYSARRGGPSSAVLLRQAFGEESNRFGQVAIDQDHVTTVRYGVRQAHSFVRVPTFGGRLVEVRAHVPLTGGFAKTSSGTHVYLEAQDDEIDTCSPSTPVPCRVVEAIHSPFSRQVRELAPRLTVEYATDRPGRPRQGMPLPFRGALTRLVVGDGEILRTDPVAGVRVELLRRSGTPERFQDTPYRGVTGPDGRYEIVVPPPIPREPWFTAVAATPRIATWAGRGTVGQSAP